MKILVVIDDVQLQHGQPSLLLRKATTFAHQMGASLELLGIAHEQVLKPSVFLDSERLRASRERALSGIRSAIIDIVDTLAAKGYQVSHDVRLAHQTTDAIIAKVQAENFDWVLKEPSENRAFMGLVTNPDWELVRRCLASVYFVKSANPVGAGVLIALEGFTADTSSKEAALDYEVYRQGRSIAEAFDTPLTLVHAYQVPLSLSNYIGYAPLLADAPPSPGLLESLSHDQQCERDAVAASHGQAIKSFAEHFSYPVADIVIREGAPDRVISEEALRRQSGLIVMGAGEAGLLDRLLRNVTAEPTLAEAECDILFLHQA